MEFIIQLNNGLLLVFTIQNVIPRNMIHKLKFIFLTHLFPIFLFAQQPLNLDFETQSVEGLKRPWGWSAETWGADFEMDSTIAISGNYSLRSKCLDQTAPCINQSFVYNIEVYELAGKEISISGFVKGEDVNKYTSSTLSLTMYNKEAQAYSFDVSSSEALSGTFDWTKISLSIDIPENISQLSLSLNHSGLGEVWYDGFALNVEGEKKSHLQSAESFSSANMEWLTNQVFSFVSPLPQLDNGSMELEDLSFFESAVGESRIVALGESTHGTSEFFALKHKLLQYAVEKMGFRVFAIEDHLMAGEVINDFVTSGVGTEADASKGLFETWNTREVHSMIQWIRDYNEIHPDDMVHFIGVDIQEVTRPIDSLLHFIKNQDPVYFEDVEVTLQQLREKGKSHYTERDTLVRMSWINQSEHIYKDLLAKKLAWLALCKTQIEKKRIEYGIQYAKMVHQYFKEIYSFGRAMYRDEAMAENIVWYYETIYPNRKMIVWAHDSHVSRGDHDGEFTNFNFGVSMGSFLSKKYKETYKSFGLATYSGDYLAFKTYGYKEQIHAPLFASPTGSLEEALHQIATKTNRKNLFLELPKTEDWLNKPLPFRFANHVNIDYGYWQRLVVPYQFDGLFFIDNTTSAKKVTD